MHSLTKRTVICGRRTHSLPGSFYTYNWAEKHNRVNLFHGGVIIGLQFCLWGEMWVLCTNPRGSHLENSGHWAELYNETAVVHPTSFSGLYGLTNDRHELHHQPASYHCLGGCSQQQCSKAQRQGTIREKGCCIKLKLLGDPGFTL